MWFASCPGLVFLQLISFTGNRCVQVQNEWNSIANRLCKVASSQRQTLRDSTPIREVPSFRVPIYYAIA